jgi:hypothetical protein
LKISSPFIISHLTYICNKSLPTRIFPDRLKYFLIIKPNRCNNLPPEGVSTFK